MAAAAGYGMYMHVLRPHLHQPGESSISLNNTDTEAFIKLYQQQELLWNVNLTDHTNKPKRIESLQTISRSMGKDWSIQQVKDKIISLRSRYSKEIVKVRVSMASGADPCYRPVWRFFPMLDSFLRPFSTTRKTDTPVVRAFHKRLMGGLSGSQPQSSARNHAAVHPPCDVPASSSNHFIHPRHSSNMAAANRYPTDQLTYQDFDDEDVQIVEEEDVSGIMEEVAMVIDDDGDDDGDNNGCNRAFQEGSFLHENFMENGKDGQSSVENEGSWGNSPGAGDIGANNSGQEGSLCDDEENSGEDPVHHQSSIHAENKSVNEKEGAYSLRGRPSLPVKNQPQKGTAFNETDSVNGCDHQNASHYREWEDVESGKIKIKQERPTDRLSPPFPPLPIRPFFASADEAHKDSSVFCATEYNHFQTSNEDSKGSYCDQTVKRGTSSSFVGENYVGESACKRIKQEKGSALCTDYPSQTEVSSSYTSQTMKGTSHRKSSFTGNRASSSSIACHARIDDFCGPSTQTNVLQHRTSSKMNNHIVSASSEPTNHTACDTVDPSSNSECDMSGFASQVTEQVSEAVSGQMAHLLQTLVTNLVEKTSNGASTDTEVAFVNYVKVEIGKLDEDLQADVKFNIQKVHL